MQPSVAPHNPSYLVVSLLVAIVIAGVNGCGDGGEGRVGTPSPVQSPPGPQTTAAPLSKLPQDFPLYPDAEPVKEERPSELRLVVTYETEDDREEVAAFFADRLNKDAWLTLTTSEPPGQELTLIVFTNRNNPDLNGSVAIGEILAEAGTDIVVELVLPGGAPLTPTPIGAPLTPTPTGQ